MNSDAENNLSITQWMQQAKAGDENARAQLWLKYYEQLIRVAKGRLKSNERRQIDEEDVVLEAFNSFFEALEAGRLNEDANRHDLWKMLVVITDNKARDMARHNRRVKRGGGDVRGHSVMINTDQPSLDGFNQLPDPTPEFADDFSFACEHLLSSLTEEQREIAIWKLKGYSNKEIADQKGCVEEAIRRKVALIRSIWSKQMES